MFDLMQVEKWTLLVALVGAAGVWFFAAAPPAIVWCFAVPCILGSVASTAVFFVWEALYYYGADQSTPGTSVLGSIVLAGTLVLATYFGAMILAIHFEEWRSSRQALGQK